MIIFVSVLFWSGIHPKDQVTWLLEVSPAIIGALMIALTYATFRLTPILYFLIFLHCIILMIVGHYTYAEVPFFEGLFGAERNNYDKLGHFFQGFVPALLAREILIRKKVVNGTHWRNIIIISICLAFSAFYELIEWWVALIAGINAESFLGTQVYVWDTQSDMWFALIGAISSLILLSSTHDKQLKAISKSAGTN